MIPFVLEINVLHFLQIFRYVGWHESYGFAWLDG